LRGLVADVGAVILLVLDVLHIVVVILVLVVLFVVIIVVLGRDDFDGGAVGNGSRLDEG